MPKSTPEGSGAFLETPDQTDRTEEAWETDESNGFTTLSWNACGMEAGAINDMFMQLGGFHWDAVLLQEGPFTDTDTYTIVQGGHALFLGACEAGVRSVGIVVNRRWVAREATMSFHSKGRRTAYVNLDSETLHVCLISTHLPHSEYSDEEFEAALLI